MRTGIVFYIFSKMYHLYRAIKCYLAITVTVIMYGRKQTKR